MVDIIEDKEDEENIKNIENNEDEENNKYREYREHRENEDNKEELEDGEYEENIEDDGDEEEDEDDKEELGYGENKEYPEETKLKRVPKYIFGTSWFLMSKIAGRGIDAVEDLVTLIGWIRCVSDYNMNEKELKYYNYAKRIVANAISYKKLLKIDVRYNKYIKNDDYYNYRKAIIRSVLVYDELCRLFLNLINNLALKNVRISLNDIINADQLSIPKESQTISQATEEEPEIIEE